MATLRTSKFDQVYGRPAITKQNKRRHGPLPVIYCSYMAIQTIRTWGNGEIRRRVMLLTFRITLCDSTAWKPKDDFLKINLTVQTTNSF